MIATRRCIFKPFVEEAKLKEKEKELQKKLADTEDPAERERIEKFIEQNKKEQNTVTNRAFRR